MSDVVLTAFAKSLCELAGALEKDHIVTAMRELVPDAVLAEIKNRTANLHKTQ